MQKQFKKKKSLKSKKYTLIKMLTREGTVEIAKAAKALYGSDNELNRERVVRLLSVYRHEYPNFSYHVRNGKIVSH